MNELLYMEIDLKKVKANIDFIKAASNKGIIPVIKSKAYAMGDIEIAKFFEDINIEYVAVVDMKEALRLLNEDIKYNILILNNLQIQDFQYLNNYPNLIVSINSLQDVINLSEFKLLNKTRLHIQIDTGMNRLGFKDKEEYYQALELIKNNDKLIIDGIYTHFTGPNNRANQESKFIEFVNAYPYKMIHCAASSTYPYSNIGNYVRVGLDIYGNGNKPNNVQSLKIACKPLKIHLVKKGETVGYDQSYLVEEDTYVAVLPIGYSNGFRRSLRGFPVMVDGKRYSSIGIVCMNHLYVKVDESVTMSSEFIITSEQLPISEMAKYLNTVAHEILCMMNIDNIRYIK